MRSISKYKKFNKYKNIVIFLLIFLSFIFIKKIFFKVAKSSDSNTEDLYKNLLIKSLSRLEYSNNFEFNDSKKSILFISDTKGEKIFVITLKGNILYEIGSGEKGFKDGGFNNARFCSPVGLEYKDDILYIADNCNDAIREVDFKKQKVSTLVKDSELLKNPVDIKFFPSENNLAISCFNQYGLIFYNTENKDLKNILEESVENRNISKIVKYNNHLYFLDKSKNSIYTLSQDDSIEKFLEVDVNLIKANSFHLDDTGIYILDKNNSKLFKANLEDKKLELYSGGNSIGNKLDNILETEFNLPEDILAVKDRLYISDTNNHRIVEIDKNKDKVFAVNIYPNSFFGDIGGLREYLNNSEFKEKIKLSDNDQCKVLLNMGSDLKFIKNAPNTLYIFEQNEHNAILLKSYSADEIVSKNLIVPKLQRNKTYYIQGTFYYQKNAELSPCLVKNYNKKLIVSKREANNYLSINF